MRASLRASILTGLLLGLGGFVWISVHRHTGPGVDPVAESLTGAEDGTEGKDAPEFIMHVPHGRERTRWSSLDDVGSNHRCNQDTVSQPQNETPCATSPVDPEVTIVGANDYVQDSATVSFFRTTDGGSTWMHSLTSLGPSGIHCEFSGDPSVAADAGGRLYAVYCVYFCDSAQGIYVQTSADNGATWSAPVAAAVRNVTGIDYDKPMAVCDVSPDSPYRNNCYIVWMNLQANYKISFVRSTDGGQSFSAPVHVSPGDSCWCPAIATGPQGQIYVTWRYYGRSTLVVARSSNGGITWEPPVTVAPYPGAFFQPNPCGSYRINHYPVIACDLSRGPNRGSVYVCWDMVQDFDANIYFSRSLNEGRTWSDTVRINDDATTRLQWWPWMIVHPRTGDIGISWLDRRNDPANCCVDVYAALSTNGGVRWTPNLRISDHNDDPRNSIFLGDYTGISWSDLGFISAWPSSRNDVCDAYAAWWNDSTGLRLTYPRGGETLSIARPCSVRWKFRYAPDTMFVELNRTYPSTSWERLDSVRSDSGYMVWYPTGPSTATARLRIIGQHCPTIGDTSDADFAVNLASPSQVTAYRLGNDIRLRWEATGAPYYHIYSSASPNGPFTTLEGTTTTAVFIDTNAVSAPLKFYIVRASTEP